MLGNNIIKNHRNTIMSKPNSRMLSRASSRTYEQKISQVTSTIKHNRLNENIIEQRKQNMLNAMFIARKNKLKEITKQNKQIYKRINSQKSLYSSRARSHSKQSRCSSRMSCNSSKSSFQQINNNKKPSITNMRFNKIRNKTVSKKQNISINMETKTIDKLKEQELQKFKSLFNCYHEDRGLSFNKQHARKKSEHLLRKSKQSNAKQTYHNNTLRYLDNAPISKPPIVSDGLLHRIAEELYSKKKQSKKVKKILN